MDYFRDVVYSNIPRNCYRKPTKTVKYFMEHRYLAIEVPSACLDFGDLKQVYCCPERSSIKPCTPEELATAADPRFRKAVELFAKLKRMCFKQIILPVSYLSWKAAFCAGWDIQDTILRLDHANVLEKAKLEAKENADHPWNTDTAMAIGVDRIIRDMNSIFQTRSKPHAPYTVTIDEPSTITDTTADWTASDLRAIYLLIHDQIARGNPYYYYSDSKGVSFDISDFRHYFPGDSTKYTDHFVYNKYDVDPFTHGRWFTGSNDQTLAWNDIKEEGGWQVRGAYINLVKDSSEYSNLFDAARRLNMSDMWVFPTPNETYWKYRTDCKEFLERCEDICRVASRYGYGQNDDRYIEKQESYYLYCKSYPHCEKCASDVDFVLERPLGFPPIVESENGYNPFIW